MADWQARAVMNLLSLMHNDGTARGPGTTSHGHDTRSSTLAAEVKYEIDVSMKMPDVVLPVSTTFRDKGASQLVLRCGTLIAKSSAQRGGTEPGEPEAVRDQDGRSQGGGAPGGDTTERDTGAVRGTG